MSPHAPPHRRSASRPRAPGRRARIAAAALLPLILTGCSGGVFDAQGPVGAADAKIMLDSVGIMLVIVVPTIIATLAFAWWYRESNTRAVYQPDFVYSGRIELIVWSIPILVIMFLGGVIWISSHQLDPYEPISSQAKPINVQVVSMDWKWLFLYPDLGVASVNAVTVPIGTPVHFSLTSATVMNAFFVPQLGSMIATMNGMQTQLHLQADRAGDYEGLSTQFSGDGFSGMRFVVHAVPQAEFDAWLANTRQNGPDLDKPAYRQLAKASQNVEPYTYRSIDPTIFQGVLAHEFAPLSGPDAGRAGPSVRPRAEH